MLWTSDPDRLAHVVEGYVGTAAGRPEPWGTVRLLRFRGRPGIEPLRAGVLVVGGVFADLVLWAASDLWPLVTVLLLAWLAWTGLRPVEIDERGIRVGSARLQAACIRTVRCVPHEQALAAAIDHSRLSLLGAKPPCSCRPPTTS